MINSDFQLISRYFYSIFITFAVSDSIQILLMKKLLSILSSFLGFSLILTSCAKYGAPVPVFEIKGKVTNEVGEPLKDMKMNVNCDKQYEEVDQEQESLTDQAGAYLLRTYYFANNRTCYVSVTDIDGEDNGGEFGTDTVAVILRDADFEKDKNGNDEIARKQINFTLKRIEK